MVEPACPYSARRSWPRKRRCSGGAADQTWPLLTGFAGDPLLGVQRHKAPFGRLVDQVMNEEPYRSARRVFWIVDNGSSHRGQRAAAELQARYPRIVVVQTPVHASWLNQIELYFSILQRKVLTPNDLYSLDELIQRLVPFSIR